MQSRDAVSECKVVVRYLGEDQSFQDRVNRKDYLSDRNCKERKPNASVRMMNQEKRKREKKIIKREDEIKIKIK